MGGRTVSGIENSLKSEWVQNGGWLNGIGLAYIFCIIAATLVAHDSFTPSFALTSLGWGGVLSLVIAAYLSICLARGTKLWADFVKPKRASLNERSIARDEPNPFAELFVYLIPALLVLAVIALSASGSDWLWPWKVDLNERWQAGWFFASLGFAFLPLYCSFRALARKVYGNDYKPDHISRQSVFYGFLIVALIVFLAWAASSDIIPENDPLFGGYVLGFVLLLFAAFILTPHVQALSQFRGNREPPSGRDEAKAAGFVPQNPALAISAFDGFLVRSLAPLSGATQHRDDDFSLLPHFLLISIFLPLTAMGFALPEPYGLFPIVFATLLAVALGRRWSWVEDDRETAMRIHKMKDKHIRIGFLNDLRDEALLGYAFLFVLIPLALRQLQLWIAPFEPADVVAAQGSLSAWAQFFGTELAKGVPIVDWADIYGIQPEVPFEAQTPFAKHLVFGARLMVDIVIIAALLQAWGIVRRNADQMTLFRDGQLDLFDPFVERTRFRRGVSLKADGSASFDKDLEHLFEEHAQKAKNRHNGRLVPYDERRLSALLHSGDRKLRATAEKLSQEYSLLVGTVYNQIHVLSDRIVTNKERIGDDAHLGWTIEQRNAFESLMHRANEENSYLDHEHVHLLRTIIALLKNESYFYDAKLMAYELLGRQKTRFGVYALASALLPPEHYGVVQLPEEVSGSPSWGFARERHQEIREAVILAVENICSRSVDDNSREARDSIKEMGVSLLRWAAENESSRPMTAAKEALERLDNATG